MIINLKQVFLQGKSIKIDDHSINISGDTFFKSDIRDCVAVVNGEVKRVNHEVYLEVAVSLKFDCLCDNCMEKTSKKYNYSFRHLVEESDTASSEDVDKITVDDYELNLDDVIIEDIILEFPMKILCNEKCLGICQKCGKNLNHGGCNCTEKKVDPRLEALRELLD